MTRWERFEDHLTDYAATGVAFNSRAIAEDLGISPHRASYDIQNYLDAQTAKNPRTKYVLTREGRTTAAMWHVGARTTDVRALGRQTSDDFSRRINRFVAPTLRRIGELNPRALPAANAVAKAIEASVELLVAMMDDNQKENVV